jgi:HAE1 family hydrophobic/amphiphilic exporter-1
MFISDLAIRKPVVTVTAMLALVVFGAISLSRLQTDEFPDIQQPIINVVIPYPGASPETVEREIVQPVEDAIFSISGIDGKRTTSSAIDGLAQFTVFFDYQKNVQQASQDIRDAISAKRADLPAEMKEPILSRFDPGDQPIVSLALTSPTLSPATLYKIADATIVRELRSVPGVAQVTVVGGQKPEMTVQLRPWALQAARLSVAEVVLALQAQNLAAPVGRLNGTWDERSIRLKGRLESPEEFSAVVVAQRSGRPIRLGEVADVFTGAEEARTLARYEGKEAVGIEVVKSKGWSTTQVADRLKERVAALGPRLPQGTGLVVVRDAGVRVRDSVTDVQVALFEGALLTVLVVFVFLNSWRSTVITGLALPISVLSSFISIWLFGYTLNTMTLLGLTLAIGILIDDAIVVRENIVRHVEMGMDHFEAARVGTAQIGLAVTATTFSIVAVFLPIAFISGVTGQWMGPFALTLAVAVLVSLLVSFSLDPMLSAYWPDPQLEAGERRGWVFRATTAFNRWFDVQAVRYERTVAWALDHRLAMVALATAAFVGALWLQSAFGGAGFVPVADNAELEVLVETPPTSNIDYTRRKVEDVERILKSHPEVAYVQASIGIPLPLRAPGVDQALIYAKLTPKRARSLSQEALAVRLRDEVARVGGATVSVFSSGFGGAFKQIQLQMRAPPGSDPRQLVRLAEELRGIVKRTPGAVDVGLSTRGEKPEIEVSLDRPIAGTLGVTVVQLAQTLRPAFAGVKAGDWVDPSGETRDVNVRLAPAERVRVAALQVLPLTLQGPDGRSVVVPLGQVATIREGIGPAQIDHLDRDKVVAVQANVQGRSLTEVLSAIQPEMVKLKLPPGWQISTGGEAEDTQEVFTQIFVALGSAVLFMYLILVVQFGSFLDPIAILVALPLSLIGVVVALLVTGDTLNIMSLIGVILLMGIVTKNSILLIDFAKWARERGKPLREALIEGGRVRLRPIVMTTVALIAGMVPVAIGAGQGGDFRAPLGRAIIGGTITSTLLTLLVVPTVYEIVDGFRSGGIRLLRRVLGRGEAPDAAGGGAARRGTAGAPPVPEEPGRD